MKTAMLGQAVRVRKFIAPTLRVKGIPIELMLVLLQTDNSTSQAPRLPAIFIFEYNDTHTRHPSISEK